MLEVLKRIDELLAEAEDKVHGDGSELVTEARVELSKFFNARQESILLPSVTRIEMISYPLGRVWSGWELESVELSLQDNNRTLKIFSQES